MPFTSTSLRTQRQTPKRADWDDLWLLMTLAGTWLLLWEGGGLVEIKARQFSLYSDLSLVTEAPAGAPSAVTRCQGNESGSWKSQGSSAARHYPEFLVFGVQSPWTCLIPSGRRFLLIRSSVTNTDKEMKKETDRLG